jgi:hypothetical protein
MFSLLPNAIEMKIHNQMKFIIHDYDEFCRIILENIPPGDLKPTFSDFRSEDFLGVLVKVRASFNEGEPFSFDIGETVFFDVGELFFFEKFFNFEGVIGSL